VPRTLFFPTAARRPAESVAFFTQPIPEPYRVPDPPLPWPPVQPQGSSSPQPAPQDTETIAKKSSNPLGDLWMLWSQNDASSFGGDLADGRKFVDSFKFQPVMPFPIFGGDWNLIVRPVFQLQSLPLDKEVGDLFGFGRDTIIGDPDLSQIVANPFGRTTGLGDTVLLTLMGPNVLDGVVWGVGASQIFPTASESILGQDKWQAGPAFLIARMAPNPGGFNVGALAQHWWSYAGEDNAIRPATNQSNIQYFINYRLGATSLIGMSPNVTIDWKNDNVTFPIGIGYSTITFMGKLPVRIVTEFQYSVIKPDNIGQEFNLRLMFIPIIPRPF